MFPMKRAVPFSVRQFSQLQVGSQIRISGAITRESIQRMANDLNWDSPVRDDGSIRSCSHWFLPTNYEYYKRSELGVDGKRELIPGARVMWAGARLHLKRPIFPEEQVKQVRTLASVKEKKGKSGSLKFLTYRSEWMDGGNNELLEEEVDLALILNSSHNPNSGRREPPASGVVKTETWNLDSLNLFTYSMLTRNPHKIHYDLDYATRVEGYENLVIHGPLLAYLALDMAQRVGAPELTTFSCRNLSPFFIGHPFNLSLTENNIVEAIDHNGIVGMRAWFS